MVWKCIVKGCTTKSTLPCHKLPANRKKMKEWLELLDRSDLILLPEVQLRKARICYKHFREDMVCFYGQRRMLKKDAFPTIHDALSESGVGQDQERHENFVIEKTPPSLLLNKTTKQLPSKMTYYRNVIQSQSHIIRHMTLAKAKSKKQHKKKWLNFVSHLGKQQGTFLEMIMKNSKTLKYGHRCRTTEKALSLTMYTTMGKRGYRALRNVFKEMPTTRALRTALTCLPIRTGINPVMVRHLALSAQRLSEKDKVCVLSFDKMQISPYTTYDIRKDIITGLEDWGEHRTHNIADHVLVFMLRGLRTGWTMPLSFSFCRKQTKGPQLARCIIDHIKTITKAGYIVLATVCDQSTSNVNAIQVLLNKTRRRRLKAGVNIRIIERKTFIVEGNEVVPIFDPSDLLKGIRNNMLQKDLLLDKTVDTSHRQYATWQTIISAYEMDKITNTICRQLRKLTDDHIYEEKIKKKQVKYASQIISGTMASCIEAMARMKRSVKICDKIITIHKEEGIATAIALDFFNNLFDSVSAKDVNDNAKLRRPVTATSGHYDFWTQAEKIVSKMRFVDAKNRDKIKAVPTIQNWLMTVQGFRMIWKIAHIKYDFQTLGTCNLNQDRLEHFFEQIRSHGFCCANPTPQQFHDSFCTLLMNNMSSVKLLHGSCEHEDDETMLFSLVEYLTCTNWNEIKGSFDETVDSSIVFLGELHAQTGRFPYFKHAQLIADSLVKTFGSCDSCLETMQHSCFPNTVKLLLSMAYKILNVICHRRRISQILSAYLMNAVNVSRKWLLCTEHRNDILKIVMNRVAKEAIIGWCSKQNRICKMWKYRCKNRSMCDRSHISDV